MNYNTTMISIPRYWPRRYTTIALCFAAIFICYIDRIAISVAIIPMAAEHGWSPSRQGFVLSSFFIGYMLTQIAGGLLADRFGGKIVLGMGVLLWSFFTWLTPLAAASGFAVLIACRIAMGLGEGVTFPSVYSLTTQWIPLRERSTAIAMGQSGIATGSIFALILTPIIATAWGWQWAFYLFGSLGVVWYAVWSWKVSASPRQHPTMSADELSLIETNSAGPRLGSDRVPWREFARSKPVWAIVVAWTCANWTIFVLLAWLPTFVTQSLGVDFKEIGLFAMAPQVASVLCMNIAGNIGDRLIRRGIPVTRVRKLMSGVGFAATTISLLVVPYVESAWTAIAIMATGSGISAASVAGAAANPMDVAPRHAGTLAGIANSIGTLPGIFGVAISGWILEVTGSWTLVFHTAAGVALFGLIFYVTFASGEKQID